MTDKERVPRFRARSYGGAGACFAMLLFLFATQRQGTTDWVALTLIACGLPFFVAAGWMTDNLLLLGDLAPHFWNSDAVYSPIKETFQVGMFCLTVGISAELDGLSLLTGLAFIVCGLAAAIIDLLHRHRITKAVDAARLRSAQEPDETCQDMSAYRPTARNAR